MQPPAAPSAALLDCLVPFAYLTKLWAVYENCQPHVNVEDGVSPSVWFWYELHTPLHTDVRRLHVAMSRLALISQDMFLSQDTSSRGWRAGSPSLLISLSVRRRGTSEKKMPFQKIGDQDPISSNGDPRSSSGDPRSSNGARDPTDERLRFLHAHKNANVRSVNVVTSHTHARFVMLSCAAM